MSVQMLKNRMLKIRHGMTRSITKQHVRMSLKPIAIVSTSDYLESHIQINKYMYTLLLALTLKPIPQQHSSNPLRKPPFNR